LEDCVLKVKCYNNEVITQYRKLVDKYKIFNTNLHKFKKKEGFEIDRIDILEKKLMKKKVNYNKQRDNNIKSTDHFRTDGNKTKRFKES